MRNLIILFAFALLAASCQEEDEKGYYLSGSIKGVEDGTDVYISEISEETERPAVIDTTQVQNGKFEIDLEDNEQPNMSFISFQGIGGNIIYISENEKINIEAYKDSLRSSKITGGKENRALNQYMTHLKEVNRKITAGRAEMQQAYNEQDSSRFETLQATEQEIKDNDAVAKKKILEENQDSYVSLMILMDMLSMKVHPVKEIQEMYSNLSEDLKETTLGKSLKETLEKQGTVAIGSKAPEFTAPTPDGTELSLSDAMGKVTIIDFWAAWCKPCRVENPNVVKIYDKYHEEGLNIIGVSLDRPGQKDKWLQAIEEDGLEWQQVSHLEFWQDPVARLYNIEAIPATFILDENGVIVDRDLRGDELEERVRELLN
ncbi:TlpA disulfide reductase family protein [Salegentibacter sp. F188]|uniref:TlpA disulfide reductase family protein n=1 Tax=Autumnicola patrickiae TaxID=3075591 RepID=A0ABU3E1B2_9FLAO|nr:TlpA disulfide reductase family protein [Salegentibacter sp. F188]MDT0689783.1 TlpA disulfide reductase family protein [Salegentibacter sp. F188]